MKFQVENGSWYLKLEKNKINKYQMAKIGLKAPMTNMVKVWSDFQGLTNETNNFAFEVNTEFRLESTILDGVGRPAGRTEKLEIKPATAQLALSLAKIEYCCCLSMWNNLKQLFKPPLLA